ncbi:hypothetical protein NPX13_g8852 [Xylaria arbuscula]|uniref:Uncharacterized protein n=1 Tax=Xylaria arbuscula TaxID=114810 RepID=A0A9W8N7Z6_9PEZI|nr:hypothetical protein NPX13_g8852 [Xylaria arbuscula]
MVLPLGIRGYRRAVTSHHHTGHPTLDRAGTASPTATRPARRHPVPEPPPSQLPSEKNLSEKHVNGDQGPPRSHGRDRGAGPVEEGRRLREQARRGREAESIPTYGATPPTPPWTIKIQMQRTRPLHGVCIVASGD